METPTLNVSTAHYACLIGAQKCGTTSLYHYLASHPAVHVIRWKEAKLFLHDPPCPEHVARYNGLCEGWTGQKCLFETSTYYAKYPRYCGVPERIARAFPQARFIYLVRDPIERIWSQYCDYLARGRESQPFGEALRANQDYLNFSRYHLQLRQYLDVFPRDRLLVLVLEEFVRDKSATMRRAFEFLGVDADFRPPNLDMRYNDGSSKRAMSRALRWARAVPGYKRLPWRLRRLMTQVFSQSLPEKTTVFEEPIQAALFDELHADTENFLKFFGRPISSWKCLRHL